MHVPGDLHTVVSNIVKALQQLQRAPAQAAAVGEAHASSDAAALQQTVSWPPGLLLSCLKVLANSLQQRSANPASVLAAVGRAAPLCPGLCSVVNGRLMPAGARGAELLRSFEVTGLLFMQLLDVAPFGQCELGITNSSSCCIAAVKAHGGSLKLLIGRALHVAAHALLQLHEQAGPTAAGPSQRVQVSESAQRGFGGTAQLLYFYLAALGPLLEDASAAATGSADGSSSAGGSTAAGSSSASVSSSSAFSLHHLTELHNQLLADTLVRLGERVGRADGTSSTGPDVVSEALAVFPAAAARQLLQLATGVCTQLVSAEGAAQCCANPGCTNCSKLSERELVAGKSTVCSGCRAVRLCSAECNTAYWKAGHRQVCKRLRGGKQQRKAGKQAQAARTEGGEVGGGQGNGSARRISSSSSSTMSSSASGSQGNSNRTSDSGPANSMPLGGSSSTGTAAAAAAGLDVPSSAAAASVLSVRQLKALLAGLRVDFGTAVEKSDLVGALVAHLGLP
jgi:hypothetical protein